MTLRECPKCKGNNLSYYNYVACKDCNEVILPENLNFNQKWAAIHSKAYINSVPRCQNYSCRGKPIEIQSHGPLWAICQECSNNKAAMFKEYMDAEIAAIREEQRLEEEYRLRCNSEDW